MMLALCFAPPTPTQMRIAAGSATFSLNYNPTLAAPTWSVCVDMQMFLVTPLIAKSMWWLANKVSQAASFIIPLGICVISTCFAIYHNSIACPYVADDSGSNTNKTPWWDACRVLPIDMDHPCIRCHIEYNSTVYMYTHVRAPAYVLGILAAFCHQKGFPFKPKDIIAKLCGLILLALHTCGQFRPPQLAWMPSTQFFWYKCLSRQVYSGCFFYLLVAWDYEAHGSGSGNCSSTAKSLSLRLLESPIFAPMAKISYVFYLIHICFIVAPILFIPSLGKLSHLLYLHDPWMNIHFLDRKYEPKEPGSDQICQIESPKITFAKMIALSLPPTLFLSSLIHIHFERAVLKIGQNWAEKIWPAKGKKE